MPNRESDKPAVPAMWSFVVPWMLPVDAKKPDDRQPEKDAAEPT